MEDPFALIPLGPRTSELAAAFENVNALGARYGLVLSPAEMTALAERQAAALRDTGRVEFGRGPCEKLACAFCDSPWVTGRGYAELLGELCALFYHFKSEAGEQWSDDELIGRMARHFNGDCRGSVELTADRLWQTLHDGPEPDDVEEEDCEQ